MKLKEFPTGSYAGLVADDVGHADDRTPLVLLHGTTFDRRMWRPALIELETIDPGRRARSPSTCRDMASRRIRRRTPSRRWSNGFMPRSSRLT